MDLLLLVLAFVLIGYVTYLLTTKIPMPPNYPGAIQLIVLIFMILYVITRVFTLPNVLGGR